MHEPEPQAAASTPAQDASPGRLKRAANEVARTLLVAVIIFAAVRLFVLPFEVEGASMTPSLANHERVLVNRAAYFNVDLNSWLNRLPGVSREGEWVFHPFSPPKRGVEPAGRPADRALHQTDRGASRRAGRIHRWLRHH